MTESTPKPILPFIWCAGLLLVPAVVFAAVADAPHLIFMTGLGLLGSLIIRKPVPRTTRSYIYAGVIVAVSTVFQHQMFTMEDDRFFLLPAEFYCPALILLGVALTYFDHRETTLSAITGSALIATMMAGNTLGAVEPNTRFAAGNLLLENMALGYLSAAVIQAVFLLLLLPHILHRQNRLMKSGRRFLMLRTGGCVLALLLVAGGAFAVRQGTLAAAPQLQSLMHRMFRHYFKYQRGAVLFDDRVNLWETVGYKQRNEKLIVIRARAQTPPGYLRGRAYHQYADGQWQGFNQKETLPYEPPDRRLATTVYERTAWPMIKTAATADFYPAGRFRSDVVPVPGNAGKIELIADDLFTDPSGVLKAEEWDAAGGYSVRVNKPLFSAAYPRPGMRKEFKEEYTGLPAEIAADIIDYAHHIFEPTAHSAQERIQQLKHHFRTDFSYELGVDVREAKDPVLDFLERTKRGHCELFATASVLLLRSQGIPARYVTGFVCAEPHPYGDYWLARLEDAHAWVEAYIPEERRWVLVETTPGTGIPEGGQRFSRFAAFRDRVFLLWHDMMVSLKRGYAARAILQALQEVLTSFKWLLLHPVRGPLVTICLAAVGVLLWHHFAGGRQTTNDKLPEELVMLQRTLHRIEKHMSRYGLTRPDNQTVREFAATARKSSAPHSDKAIELLYEYEALRYNLPVPDRKLVNNFNSRVQERLKGGSTRPADA